MNPLLYSYYITDIPVRIHCISYRIVFPFIVSSSSYWLSIHAYIFPFFCLPSIYHIICEFFPFLWEDCRHVVNWAADIIDAIYLELHGSGWTWINVDYFHNEYLSALNSLLRMTAIHTHSDDSNDFTPVSINEHVHRRCKLFWFFHSIVGLSWRSTMIHPSQPSPWQACSSLPT